MTVVARASIAQSMWALLAALLFSLMAVFVKRGLTQFAPMELVFYRAALGAAALFALARFRARTFRTAHFRLHLWRGATGFGALSLFFFALGGLPLSTSLALMHTAPVFFAALTMVILRERPGAQTAAALLLSFAGAIVVLRPQAEGVDLRFGAAGLLSGFFAGCAYFNVRNLGRANEGGMRTVFYFTFLSSLFALVLVAAGDGFGPVDGGGAITLAAIAICATGAQFAITRALHRGHSFLVSALGYAAILFSGFWDFAIWGRVPGWATIVGASLIVCGGVWSIAAVRARSR